MGTNGFREGADAVMFKPVSCGKCGCEWFDSVPRKMIHYHRLTPSKVQLTPGEGYRCSDCGEPLNPQARIDELVKGDRPIIEGSD